ncbi:MAG: hypothetical protein KDI30_11980, partial [Pseudomonadales bacterium]|nr:hypothetical protein [Pseudomonadales bacterium]
MSQCPFRNTLDPDIFTDGKHHQIFADIRERGGALAKIDDPIENIPYWSVMKRDLADYICKHPLAFS